MNLENKTKLEKITDDQLYTKKHELVLVTTPFCGVCAQVEKALEIIKEMNEFKLNIVKLDHIYLKEVSEKYKIQTAPSILYKDLEKDDYEVIHNKIYNIIDIMSIIEEYRI